MRKSLVLPALILFLIISSISSIPTNSDFNADTLYFSSNIKQGLTYTWLYYENTTLSERENIDHITNQTLQVKKTPGTQDTRSMIVEEYFNYYVNGENTTTNYPIMRSLILRFNLIRMLLVPTIVKGSDNLFQVMVNDRRYIEYTSNSLNYTVNNSISDNTFNIEYNLTQIDNSDTGSTINIIRNARFVLQTGILLYKSTKVFNITKGPNKKLGSTLTVLHQPPYEHFIKNTKKTSSIGDDEPLVSVDYPFYSIISIFVLSVIGKNIWRKNTYNSD